MSAAQKGHAECVRLLLEGGADKEAKENVRANDDLFVCKVFHYGALTKFGFGVCVLFNFVRQYCWQRFMFLCWNRMSRIIWTS